MKFCTVFSTTYTSLPFPTHIPGRVAYAEYLIWGKGLVGNNVVQCRGKNFKLPLLLGGKGFIFYIVIFFCKYVPVFDPFHSSLRCILLEQCAPYCIDRQTFILMLVRQEAAKEDSFCNTGTPTTKIFLSSSCAAQKIVEIL